MRVPLSWLRDFADFPTQPDELARTFDELGLVVEGVERAGAELDGVIVARVVAVGPIAGADRIRLVEVDEGSGGTAEIVCGAFNFGAGDLVALATPGTELPNGVRIERRQVRGAWSSGMICSAAELALGDDRTGILVLAAGLVPGTPLAEALELADVVFDLDITPNRPDAMSVAGVARDAAAKLGLAFTLPDPPVPAAGGEVVVRVEAPELCSRFTGTVLVGVTVGPSPAWLARRLTLAGMRPINN
ncbi:MAG: phenylalanine--tRNA ligase subunit beta, partial [Acidimicrobiales bacterium]